MVIKVRNAGSNPSCKHNWIKRSKVTIQVLERVCTECGAIELHSSSDKLKEEDLEKVI